MTKLTKQDEGKTSEEIRSERFGGDFDDDCVVAKQGPYDPNAMHKLQQMMEEAEEE